MRNISLAISLAVSNAIRNFSIAVCVAAGLSALYRSRISRRGPLLRVLVFHDIQDREWLLNMLELVKAQYHVATPEECFGKKLDPCRINVLITFDDGYASWIDVILPVLSALKIKAIFFVSSGLLDAHDDATAQSQYVKEQLLVSPRETLSWDGARALHRAGHTIGGHTVTHPRLSKLQDHVQRAEIEKDKERIETMLRTSISAFAYPFGDYTSHTEKLVQNAGYTYVFSGEARFATLETLLRIPRLHVEHGMATGVLKKSIEGGYDVLVDIKRLFYKRGNSALDGSIPDASSIPPLTGRSVAANRKNVA